MNIAWKELYAIVVAVHTWGNFWQHQKILFNCDNHTVVDIWEKGSTKSPKIMSLVRLLYLCAAHHNINICIKHIPGTSNNIAVATYFSLSGCSLQRTGAHSQCTARQHPCVANPSLQHHLIQFCYHGVAKSTRRTYKSGLTAFIRFCSRFNITPFPATSLTLQYFCADRSQCISYKTLKVNLAAVRLMHIEQGLSDPTTDELLHLVCRGIHRQQTTPECKRLPITIDILKTLKSQLRLSNYPAREQRMLWSAFTLSFYGFLHASEGLSLT